MKILNVSLGEYGYEGNIELQAWDEFLTDLNGVYGLDIGGDMVEENPTITQEHVVAFNYAKDNQIIIRDSIITVLMEKYPELQRQYGYDEDETEESMPDIRDKEDFKDLIGLSKVHIMNIFRDGIAYTGYEFTCSWDEEHGLGLMMYQNKVVSIGEAATSFLTWIAEEDAKQFLMYLKYRQES